MPSGIERIMDEVLFRMRAAPALVKGDIKRAHRTPVTLANSDAIHIIDGNDAPLKNKCEREADFTVRIIARSDAGASAADPLKVAVYARLAASWPTNITVVPGRISVVTEIADQDVTAVDMEFTTSYPAGEWSLG